MDELENPVNGLRLSGSLVHPKLMVIGVREGLGLLVSAASATVTPQTRPPSTTQTTIADQQRA